MQEVSPNTMRRLLLAACAAIAVSPAVLMVGCGSSGGDSPALAPITTAPITPPAQPAQPADPVEQYALQTTVPTSTYVAGTMEDGIFKAIARARGSAYGYMNQDMRLDVAAKNHAAYVAQYSEVGHTERSGVTGFTGVDPTARAVAAGYPGTAGEIVGGYSTLVPGATAEIFVYGVLSSTYHAQALLSNYRDLGVGIVHDSKYDQDIVVLNLGVKSSARSQLMPAGAVKAYPADGQTGVVPRFYVANETPRPLPELSVAGHPAFFSVENVTERDTAPAGVLVQVANIRDAFGNLVPSLLMTAPGVQVDGSLAADHRPDTVNKLMGTGNLFIVPRAILLPLTKYTATVQVKTPNATYSKTWSFTTGDQS